MHFISKVSIAYHLQQNGAMVSLKQKNTMGKVTNVKQVSHWRVTSPVELEHDDPYIELTG